MPRRGVGGTPFQILGVDMGISDLVSGAVGGAVEAGVGYFAQKKAASNQRQANRLAYEREKEFAQNQIQWKVQDAVKAGLHPLAGLGVNPASANASAQVGGDSQWASNLGQDLSRAISAGTSQPDKTAVEVTQLGVERARLENELVKTQIASQRMRNIQQGNPGVPGQLGSGVNGSLAIPGTKSRLPQEHPNLAQDAENAYGELGGEMFGFTNLAVDVYRYLGLESILTRDDITPAMQHIVKKFVSQPARKSAGGFPRYGGR